MAKRQVMVKRDEGKDLLTQTMETAEKQFKTKIDPGVKWWLESSCTMLNMAISGRGFPAGRISEIFGPESGGKSSLLYDLIGVAQRMSGFGVLIDVEGTFDPDFAANICHMHPVHGEGFVYVRENVLERIFDGIEKFVKLAAGTEAPVVIGLDTVAACCPESLSVGHESMMGKRQTGKPPSLWSWFLSRGIIDDLAMGNIYLILLNQVRDQFNFFDPSANQGPITVGGKAIRYYSSVRMEVSQDDTFYDEGAHPVHVSQKVELVKNKVAPNRRTAMYHFYNTTLGPRNADGIPVLGIDDLWSCAQFAISRGLVRQAGSWYSFDEVKAQGEENFIQALRESPAAYQSLRSSIPALYRSEYGF